MVNIFCENFCENRLYFFLISLKCSAAFSFHSCQFSFPCTAPPPPRPPYPMHRQSPWQLPPSFALLLLLLPLENSSLLVILRNQPLFRSPLHFSPVTKQVCCPHCYYFHHIYFPWFDFMNMSKGKLSTFFFNVLFFSMAIILIITWVVSFEVTFV